MRVGDILNSRFEILGHYATGGMGHVYRARDLETNAQVAVKALRRTAGTDVQRFEREAKLLAKLEHPRIVRYVSAGVTHEGVRYLVEEWVAGVSLREYMAQKGLTPREAVQVVRNLAEALAEAHRHGIVHRDVKPDNIILESGLLDKLRLLDFGIARVMFESMNLTRTGTMVGTPSYMAPEQARGRPDIDERADVFALGCLLYECLTGKRPFPGPTLVAVRTKVIICQPTPVERGCPEIPKPLARLVERMLAKDAKARPRDAGVVLTALNTIKDIPDEPRRTTMARDPKTGAQTIPAQKRDTRADADDQELTCVVLAASTAEDDEIVTTQVACDIDEQTLTELRQGLAALDAKLEVLDGGAVVVTLASQGDARDCASRAARAALLVKQHLPGKSVAIASSRGDKSKTVETPLGQAIDWVAQAVEAAEIDAIFADFHDDLGDGSTINVDDVVARLLPPEFNVEQEAEGSWQLSDSDPNPTVGDSR